MKMLRLFLLPVFATVTSLAAPPAAEVVKETEPPDVITYGSCARQKMDQPIWDAINALRPDLFIFMGDNVYADTTDEAAMRQAYDELAQKSGFQQLRSQSILLPIWDDHDYGKNDAGAEFEAKEMAQRVFLEFFQVPPTEPRKSRPGLYGSYLFGPAGKQVKVILLDTRWFRSPLVKEQKKYVPADDPDKTMLGEAQWAWLQEELRTPAQITLIVSSIQVLPHQHPWEKWHNLPLEREKLLNLIAESGAPGVILLSGDRHAGEISKLPADAELGPGYPLYEVTSSSLNLPIGRTGEPNEFRVTEDRVFQANFGAMLIDWDADDPVIRLQLRGVDGEVAQEIVKTLSELRKT